MKTIKITLFNILLNILLIIYSINSNAQSSKTYKETFTVEDQPELKVNLKNADVSIETWSKNKIQAEATLTYEGDEKSKASTFFKECPIKILGNSRLVEITSCQKKFDNPFVSVFTNYDEKKDESEKQDGSTLNIPTPPRPPKPPKLMIKKYRFDHKRFDKEGEDYLREFQQKIKDSFDIKAFEKKMEIWSKKFADGFAQKFEDGKMDSIIGQLTDEKTIKKMKVLSQSIEKKLKPMMIRLQSMGDEINLGTFGAENKISREVTIKIPEDAIVDIDLNQGKISIGKVQSLNTTVKYGELVIDELLEGKHNIKAKFSKVAIKKADGLNLEIRYARNVDISEVKTINVKANASNLKIGKLEKEAIINGKLGELRIDQIGEDFEFIDIDLKNTDAILNLPDVDYQFYGNMRSCKVDVKDQIDLNKRSSFDKIIYQNGNKNSNQMININAAFSKISLQ